MSHGNVEKMMKPATPRLSGNFLDYFESLDQSKWVNGRPVLLNGATWCDCCGTWHKAEEHYFNAVVLKGEIK